MEMGLCLSLLLLQALVGVVLLLLVGGALRLEYGYLGIDTGPSTSNTALIAAAGCGAVGLCLFCLGRRRPRQATQHPHDEAKLLLEVEMEYVHT